MHVRWDPKVLRARSTGRWRAENNSVFWQPTAKVRWQPTANACTRIGRREERLIERGSTPSLRVRTVTESKSARGPAGPLAEGAAGQSKPALESVRLESTDAPRAGRPHGKRFGVLVHAVLATVDLAANAETVTEVARTQGRLVDASAEEIAAASFAAARALEHPLLAETSAAKEQCRRECPILGSCRRWLNRRRGARFGISRDRQARARWVVVDFKTDVELSARRADYERQVGDLLRKPWSHETGDLAEGYLLSV